MTEVAGCNEHFLDRAPPKLKKAATRVIARFEIESDGTVGALAITERAFDDAELARCVGEVVRNVKFPAEANREPMLVSYPFVFEPGR